jgi:hypothetical protein
MTLSIEGFRHQRVPVAGGVALHTAVGGTGTPATSPTSGCSTC